MKQHEREFFVAQIRSGDVVVKKDSLRLVIKPLTLSQSFEACEVYNDALSQAYVDGIMTQDEMEGWMRENGLWSKAEDNKIEGIKKDLEKLKVGIYDARLDVRLKEQIRRYIRAGENQLAKLLSTKHQFHQNTQEGVASAEKVAWSIRNSTYLNGQLYDFGGVQLSYIVDEWQGSTLSDTNIRELARNEPWKSLWIIRESSKTQLFSNSDGYELTYNQKNLIIWSQMYDNIQESMECPPKDVIDDDDMLDGWFIKQAKKREQERLTQELDSNVSDKIKNSAEVFLVADSDEDAERIESMNSAEARLTKKQRSAFLQRKDGQVAHHDLPDVRRQIGIQHAQAMSRKIKGG